ncbi:MAG: aminotransferase class V-fold PLP-dependent enzyme [Acidiferrobacterales bacterium]|nr:aminotransferase class V-fold PLP-dependent enzyme [Acidiferrobacterales bacterium]
MSKPQFDLRFIRSQFPNIGDWAFFENAGGTFVPSTVSDRVYDYMRCNQVQPGAPYRASAQAQQRIDRSHQKLAELVNAAPEEVIVGHSTTMNVYVLANALKPSLKAGDEIVVTNLDHEPNIGSWRRLEDAGVTIRQWEIDPDTADLGGVEKLAPLLSDRTRLVCCTWCSNITGAINDIRSIADLVHSAGALICVDAVAYAPHRALDFQASSVDFLLFSLYKLYGPHLGVLCGKKEHLLKLENQNHFFFTKSALPCKLQPGGYLHETAASIEGIGEYFDRVFHHHFGECGRSLHDRYIKVFEMFAAHEDEIARPLMDYLNTRNDVRIIGPAQVGAASRVPTISFAVEGKRSDKVAEQLGYQDIGIGSGNFYAKRCVDALGLDRAGGVIRISMVHYNSASEVERLIAALDSIL